MRIQQTAVASRAGGTAVLQTLPMLRAIYKTNNQPKSNILRTMPNLKKLAADQKPIVNQNFCVRLCITKNEYIRKTPVTLETQRRVGNAENETFRFARNGRHTASLKKPNSEHRQELLERHAAHDLNEIHSDHALFLFSGPSNKGLTCTIICHHPIDHLFFLPYGVIVVISRIGQLVGKKKPQEGQTLTAAAQSRRRLNVFFCYIRITKLSLICNTI